MNTLMIGICTYNRKDIVRNSALSLQAVRDLDQVKVRVYDDCSSEYGKAFLEEMFPFAEKITRFEENGGADKNTSRMYEDFLKSGAEWLLNADSDLVYRTDLIGAIMNCRDRSEGIFTVYNSINHNTIGETESFYIKDSVGAAGCVLRRDIVEMILNSIQYRDYGFDVGFSKLLRTKAIPLYATKQSYVQHIGVLGFNSRDIRFDYAENFLCEGPVNAGILEETFETYMKSVSAYRKKPSYQVYYFLTSVPRRARRVVTICTALLSARKKKGS